MQTLTELLTNMAHSSTEGKFGVAGILIFFIIIVATACYRIKQNLENEKYH
ncbi:hypothetical protein [Desulfonauticus submarinus]